MKKQIRIMAGLILTVLFVANVCYAGLINYDRRNRNLQRAADAPATPAPVPVPTRTAPGWSAKKDVAVTVPKWMVTAPRVSNRFERRYDANKDRRLQVAEVKRFLSDVIKEVENDGRYKVNSDILKIYDTNRDGVIRRYELGPMRKDLRTK